MHLKAEDIYDGVARLKSARKRFNACSAVNLINYVLEPDLVLFSIRGNMLSNGLLTITVPKDFFGQQKLPRTVGLIDREFWFALHQQMYN